MRPGGEELGEEGWLQLEAGQWLEAAGPRAERSVQGTECAEGQSTAGPRLREGQCGQSPGRKRGGKKVGPQEVGFGAGWFLPSAAADASFLSRISAFIYSSFNKYSVSIFYIPHKVLGVKQSAKQNRKT